MSAEAEWKFTDLLKEHDIKPADVYKNLEPRPNYPTTLYRWAKRKPESVDLDLLASIVIALRKITGKPIEMADLVDIKEVA